MTSKSILLLEKIGTQGYVLCDDIPMEKNHMCVHRLFVEKYIRS